jgi:DNA-binding NtrC family response regulator
MIQGDTKELLQYLIDLCEAISRGKYGKVEELFELTKEGCYPPLVTELAEAFGMMMVKVEAREYRLEQLVENLTQARENISLSTEPSKAASVGPRAGSRQKFAPHDILGRTEPIVLLLQQVERACAAPANVLITGETGTGKELVARAIHYGSDRAEAPFVAVNCSAIPESIFESEIFGIEKGVATGVESRIGKLEQAHRGTLFLDEVAEMPLAQQTKLLRVLEEKTFERVGGRKTISVDIRVIAATNKDLMAEVKKAAFREDLYYRLNVLHLRVPPLRERRDDIELLANHFLEKSVKRLNRFPLKLSTGAIELLLRYPWPGNIRELGNQIERAVTLCRSETITPSDLTESILDFGGDTGSEKETLSARDNEARLIRNALVVSRGNKSHAARLLGISREGLRKKLKRHSFA